MEKKGKENRKKSLLVRMVLLKERERREEERGERERESDR